MLNRISDEVRPSRWRLAAALLLAALFSLAFAQPAQRPHVAEFSIEGPIGPATTDYLVRAMEEAQGDGAELFLIRMDTPGGLDAATRDIIKHILASDIPVTTYVNPAGARAASAGTYILYASQIAAMTPSTTLGAATPVQMGGVPGQQPPGEQPQQGGGESEEKPAEGKEKESGEEKDDASKPGTAMERKVTNDAVAFIRGLANRHGRNADWAEKAVREAATLTAGEALEQNVIDIVADNREDLLEQVAGREVVLDTGEATVDERIAELPVQTYEPDWRNEILALITNPQIAYILLLIGIYGLIFEGYNPGAMVPGIVGVICLLLAFYALQVLPINYAGLALIIVGALLIVAELFMPSFGALGIGGVIALVIGSVMLIDTDVPGMQVSRGLIGAIAGVSGLAVLGILLAVGKSVRQPRIPADQALVGRSATVSEIQGDVVLVHVGGEIWRATCDVSVAPGDRVTVTEQHGLRLKVEPSSDSG
ncbi:NfeD family protein [Microbulbifer halophilus]|uniref:Nodulation protein NfeD n=1 Tax=Microbulbifer halophilus TaxID=453963 RepID=A0ABW5EF01_9GAMM|nr:nodulation protein NfeD [Microbulbifer halophilus]MCW8124956.1 nodulation protein NfeD [Microbulbifer halophilus]